jgi:hypothetical protein
MSINYKPKPFDIKLRKMKGKCYLCGRYGHYAKNCFAKTSVSGKRRSYEDECHSFKCFKCGCYGHFANECFSVKRVHTQHTSLKKRSGVYVIKHQDGKIYVGKSNDIDSRIAQHAMNAIGKGSVSEIPTITKSIGDDFESWERNETLAQMVKYGVDNVRGWMYTSKCLSKSEIISIEQQIREKYDLCRKCGLHGHFANECHTQEKTDHEKSFSFESGSEYSFESESSEFDD